MSDDLTTRIITAMLDHWPLLAGLGILGRWGFPWALKHGLSNGSGEIVRSIVAAENAKQVESLKTGFDERFRKHEEAEERRFLEIEDRIPRKRR